MKVEPGRYIDTVIEALYDSVCGPAGYERDWERMLSLFLPGAQIMRADMADGGCSQSVVLGIKEFINSVTVFLNQNGFFGLEVARRTVMLGSVAKVFSTYEARFNLEDQKPFRRGINRIQLYHDRERWWIINMLLDIERDDNLPTKAPHHQLEESHGNQTQW